MHRSYSSTGSITTVCDPPLAAGNWYKSRSASVEASLKPQEWNAMYWYGPGLYYTTRKQAMG